MPEVDGDALVVKSMTMGCCLLAKSRAVRMGEFSTTITSASLLLLQLSGLVGRDASGDGVVKSMTGASAASVGSCADVCCVACALMVGLGRRGARGIEEAEYEREIQDQGSI